MFVTLSALFAPSKVLQRYKKLLKSANVYLVVRCFRYFR